MCKWILVIQKNPSHKDASYTCPRRRSISGLINTTMSNCISTKQGCHKIFHLALFMFSSLPGCKNALTSVGSFFRVGFKWSALYSYISYIGSNITACQMIHFRQVLLYSSNKECFTVFPIPQHHRMIVSAKNNIASFRSSICFTNVLANVVNKLQIGFFELFLFRSYNSFY